MKNAPAFIFLVVAAIAPLLADRCEAAPPESAGGKAASAPAYFILSTDSLHRYFNRFNQDDDELYINLFPNSKAEEFLAGNIPLFECPDKNMEETYYFRWWTYRKHIKKTPDGFVVTEFLPKVSWSGKYNTINCPAGHHLYEGRWLHDPKVLDDYSIFWFRKGGKPRDYSFWAADSIWARSKVTGNTALATNLLPDLVRNYEGWERERLDPCGLFWQDDGADGMEVSIGGSGLRATINSYMYGDALAIAQMAEFAEMPDLAKKYRSKGTALKQLVQSKLWDPEAKFFKVLGRAKDNRGKFKLADKLADVREEHGLTPWYFNLPDEKQGYEEAWRQLMDPQGFLAPFGPTSAEQRHPGFKLNYTGHECQWNGPSWPYATSVTLTAMANVLNNYEQQAINKRDYFEILSRYTQSHRRTREDGKIVPWIDENLNPVTGDWLSRTRLKTWNRGTWDSGKGGRERGKDYNHSTYNDLIITGLVGLRPDHGDQVIVNPLVPEDQWDYFCLDHVLYHGHILTILWDKTGDKYGKGQGLRVFADKQQIASTPKLTKLSGQLPK
ncbi:MAG: hypothetical protein K8T91_15155 [Planctomycetes bacterium]|nr:hypothetical protein [Planctomycetota bacterium]